MKFVAVGASLLTAIAIGIGIAVTRGGGSGESCSGFHPGPDDACGTPLPCTNTISSGLDSAWRAASGGDVICLRTGSYSFQEDNVAKASMVTVEPANGATATITHIGYSNISNTTFWGYGGTLEIEEISADGIGSGSHHMAFEDATFTGGSTFYTPGRVEDALFDHDRFDNLPVASGGEGRLSVVGRENTAPVGLTIRNSHFGNGGCSDGIQILGDTYGVQIGPGNEFSGFNQGSCGPHVDPIQFFGSRQTVVTGNWFHDNGDSTGGVMAFDGANHDTVTQNVFNGSTYTFSVALEACDSCAATHNVFMNNDLDFGHKDGDPPSTDGIVRDNLFVSPADLTGGDLANVTEDHNLCWVGQTSCAAGSDIHNSPVFAGGSNPLSFTKYDDYVLAPASAGYHAGSDGQSIGIAGL